MTQVPEQAFYHLECFAGNEAVVDVSGHSLSYLELAERVKHFQSLLAQQHSRQRLLVFIRAKNTLATLIAYLACLRSGHVALLLDSGISDDSLQSLIHLYSPNALIDGSSEEIGHITWLSKQPCVLHADLAILLSTSGSTGSPKLVRLSWQNLQQNAQSITGYLPIRESDTAITALPFCYSYGLSIINTHLLQGARLALTDSPIQSREFWQLVGSAKVSSFSGVPLSFSLLQAMRFERQCLPDLRYLTCAGGKLNAGQWDYLAKLSVEKQLPVYAMYGQTEATARMAYLPHEDFVSHPGAMGKAIPGGQLVLRDAKANVIKESNVVGELFYQGPNVMMGYAGSREDLASGTEISELATGDLARRNGDYFYIEGRLKRFIKVTGLRINLDDIERYLAQRGVESRATGEDDALHIAIQQKDLLKGENTSQSPSLVDELAGFLTINPRYIAIKMVDTFPVLSSGKTDYVSLARLFDNAA